MAVTVSTTYSLIPCLFSLYINCNRLYLLLMYVYTPVLLSSCSSLFPLVVTVQYEEEQYSVEEQAGYITLALVLEGNATIPVTVSVNTLDLQNSSVGAAATGKLLHGAELVRGFAQCTLR